jgi:hypothetical protein
MVANGGKWVPSWLSLPAVKGGGRLQPIEEGGRVIGGATIGAPWRGRRMARRRARRRRHSAGVAKGRRRDQGWAASAKRVNRLAGGWAD